MGLDQVRELTRRTQERIMRLRPFSSLSDFLARVDPRPLEAENLIRVSAFEGLGEIPQLLRQSEIGDWRGGQLTMFSTELDPDTTDQDWSLEEKILAQEAILGVSVSAHRLELYVQQIKKAGALNTADAAPRLRERLRVAGVRLAWQRRKTQSGDYIYLMDLVDLEGMLLVMIPADVHRRHRQVFSKVHPFIVEGVMSLEGRFNEPTLRAEKAWKLA
jgi:DNA polymerase III alpha subunit